MHFGSWCANFQQKFSPRTTHELWKISKIWPKFESFHSSCSMRLSVENWCTKKYCPHFMQSTVRRFRDYQNKPIRPEGRIVFSNSIYSRFR